jgi:hypothetical protein
MEEAAPELLRMLREYPPMHDDAADTTKPAGSCKTAWRSAAKALVVLYAAIGGYKLPTRPTIAAALRPASQCDAGFLLPEMNTFSSILSPHDPGIVPWLIVAAYFVGCAASVRAWRAELVAVGLPPRGTSTARAALLADRRGRHGAAGDQQAARPACLGHPGGAATRALARVVQEPPNVQLAFVMFLAAAALVGFLAGAYRLRRALRRYALALVGLWILALYVGLRAVSFHHVDVWLGTRVRGLKIHWVIELAGVTTIAAGAWTAERLKTMNGTSSERSAPPVVPVDRNV